MSVRDRLRQAKFQLQWNMMDRAIAFKERFPFDSTERSSRFGYALISPGVLLVGFLAVGFALLTWYSFLTYDPVEVFVYEYTLNNWERFFQTSALHQIYFRTTLYSVGVTLFSVVLAIPYAYLVVRTERTLVRQLLLFGLFVPFFSGVIIRAYGWLIILGQGGLINWLFTSIGLGPQNYIGTSFAVIIGLVQYMLPFAVLMLTPAMASIDRDLERAAKNCGADSWRTFRYIVLPLARPGITSATIIVFTLTMANYSIPKLLGGGTVSFAATFMYQKIFTTLNYPLAAVLSIVLTAIASIIVFGVFKIYGTGTLGAEDTT
ncbi:ABC transporter permease [Halococcus sp. AFM35]|uniref:ABC transporter permease n=1 Tax=Halococcus sp. AFM35 TaxID=3421653 RepID=UPI003EB92777